MEKVAVIGLGYVGLPLSLVFAEAGLSVVGLDLDETKVGALNAGRSYIRHIDGGDIAAQVEAGRFLASCDYSLIEGCDAVVICVPSPLNKYREPDLSFILSTAEEVGRHLAGGPKKVVVLESTTYPGTTEEEMREVLERESGLKAGDGFHLAFSPEREDPGNPASKVRQIPKIIGGFSPECTERALELYGKAVEKPVPVSSCRVAEATKLTENIFRSVNIALVNELKVVFAAMGIDVWEVIDAAKTKPFGFMPFYPGPGLGGHCIPIDPFYLTWKAREFGLHTRFIELAGEMNDSMLSYTVSRVSEALNHHRKPLMGSRILIVGLAYKPEVDDMRESPSLHLMDRLHALGAEVSYHDPYIPVVPETREHAHWAGSKSADWTPQSLSSFDAVLIATNHRSVDYALLLDNAHCIIDCRNAMKEFDAQPGQIWKA